MVYSKGGKSQLPTPQVRDANREAVGNGRKMKNFTVEKLDKHYLSQMIKININEDFLLIVCTFEVM